MLGLDGASGGTYTTLYGNAGSLYGRGLARIGDVDGDGRDDFAIGAPRDDGDGSKPDRGRVDVFSGDSSATYLGSIEGDDVGDRLGESLAGLGDVDGDGVPDFLAGAPFADGNGTNSGYVLVVSGATLATIHKIHGDPGDWSGFSVCRAGDLDRDGVEDFAAGAPEAGSNMQGMVRVFSGLDGSVLWDFDASFLDADGTVQDLGYAIAAGEFNQDGIAGDLLLGDPTYLDSTLGQVGAAWVFLGCPAWWENYGAGWPGKNGVPNLVALDDPDVGGTVDVQIDNSLGSPTAALLVLGFSEADVPTSADGTLLVTPFLFLPVPLDASGIVLSGQLPDDPALLYFEIFLQALEADPFASAGISFTPGLKLHLGFDV